MAEHPGATLRLLLPAWALFRSAISLKFPVSTLPLTSNTAFVPQLGSHYPRSSPIPLILPCQGKAPSQMEWVERSKLGEHCQGHGKEGRKEEGLGRGLPVKPREGNGIPALA